MSPIFCHWSKWRERPWKVGRARVCMGVGSPAGEAHNIARMERSRSSSRAVKIASSLAMQSGIEDRGKVYACVLLLTVLIFLVDINFQLVAFGGFYAIPILISLW